ncbi:pimeloyl-ACP methyl ester carboxylesterase [Pedobacter sp. AK017]|uniref:hypothetical protein n=1 Tax=Pedobacter sp. AK017 TaxID=2723073 RepID=UPI00161B44B8|nr:hypothetical protein [Pedobacter sp. AK017]MBB5441230.1 pimeloyl-ACP methyl ester carboxylesterase [Pedobacter sp. AK017]
MKEEVITLNQSSVIGIISYSASLTNLPVVVFINAGLIHRVGPNRIYVKLARQLAARGHHVFRFDYNGRGDSLLNSDQQGDTDIPIVLNYLEKKLKRKEFILAGMCSGAEASYHSATADGRVKGIIMINGTGLSSSDYLTLHTRAVNLIQMRYYKDALLRPAKWLEVLKSNGPLLAKKVRSFHQVFKKNLKETKTVPIPINHPFTLFSTLQIEALIILTEGSTAYDMIKQLNPKVNGNKVSYSYRFLKGVDHNISTLLAQEELTKVITHWLSNKFKNDHA